MFYHTESKPQGWRALATFDDRPDRLLYLGRSSTQVRAGFIQVRSISSTGVGFRGAGLIVDGGLDIGDVQAGRSGADAGPSER